jgi:PAS domain S-box-containing protein
MRKVKFVSERPNDTKGGARVEADSYRLLVAGITDYAIYMLDPEGHVLNWNAGAERFKGYVADEIVGQHFSRFYTPADQARGLPQHALRTALAEGKFEADGLRVRKDGSTFWAHVVIDPIRDDNGKLIGFAKITRDLSDRSAAEATLRRSEDQFKLLVQSVTDYAIYMLDREGHVASWNSGAHRIKGYTPEEIIGEHFSRFYTEEDRANGEPARALATAEREGRYARGGWRVRKDGQRFWASVVIDPIHDEGDELLGFAKVTRDLTEREQAARELEATRETLLQAQKMDAIGQLTGGIAHDFNNLLMATLSSLELLRKRIAYDPRAFQLLDNAIEGAQRGARLTQRMLAFARRQELTLTRVDIPTLVRGMSDLIERSLGSSFAIDTRFPLRLDAVTADVNQMEMGLLNLVVNARDAMADGGVITISARRHVVGADGPKGLTPGEYVALCVIDTGEGMDADTLSRATEPFFTTKGIGKGTGLGLSMVHGIAEQSNGRLILHSVVGKGTTAELWLPVAERQEEKAEEVSQPQQPIETRPLTVLAVDDDALVLMNTVALLEDLGHTVFEAVSGEEALAIFRREPSIDLIITDQAMPRMTGVQFAEAVLAERGDVPIILATGYGELPAGANSSLFKLSKPFGQIDLARVVAQASQTGG